VSLHRDGVVVCPICRHENKVEGANWPASFRINLTIQNLIAVLHEHKIDDGDAEQPSEGASVVICENCEENPATATRGCVDCKMVYCDECSKNLHANKAMKTHKVIPINEYLVMGEESKKADAMAALFKCRSHPSKMLEYCCKQVSELV
jgi:hypothetical protein